jgi:hypothetical protein
LARLHLETLSGDPSIEFVAFPIFSRSDHTYAYDPVLEEDRRENDGMESGVEPMLRHWGRKEEGRFWKEMAGRSWRNKSMKKPTSQAQSWSAAISNAKPSQTLAIFSVVEVTDIRAETECRLQR